MRQILVIATVLAVLASAKSSAADMRADAGKIVVEIQRADYEGNRPRLKQLYEDLEPFLGDKALASRVRYWRGFALWRRALNGFNDSVDSKELEQDLQLAVTEFKASNEADPSFVEAKIGEGSCLSNLMYLNSANQSRLQELILQARLVFKEAEAQAPDNPRLAWVLGPNLWYQSRQADNQTKAIETYQRGLETIRKQRANSTDPLEPSWGEPELLANLAWSNLHRRTPDVKAAQAYAQSALTLVPYWHYVRDILLPQIHKASEVAQSR